MKIEDVRNAPEGTEITVDAATREVLSMTFPDPKRPPVSATQDAPSGRVGLLRFIPDDNFRHLVREVEGGWSYDDSDGPNYLAKCYPGAVFTPIATLPEGYVAVKREDLHCAVTVLDALDPFLDPNTERWLIRLSAALEGGRS